MTLVDVQSILAIAKVVASLVESGAMTVGRMRVILAQNGASPEQLQELDDRLSAAILAREGE